MDQVLVRKADGSLEPFDYRKFRRALRKAGAKKSLVEEVIESLQPRLKDGITTDRIYKMAFKQLKRLRPSAAARYGLKSALMRLGPEGYPFETYVGSLLKGRGYETQLRQIISGRCISHEIDVVASRPKIDNKRATKSLVECKFHNSPHIKCHIQSALYTWARFLDIRNKDESYDSVWLATNTKFTTDVIQYSDCVGLKLVGWSFPHHESLQDRIEEHKMYPITIIPKLDRHTFRSLHDGGIIILQELISAEDRYLRGLGIKEKKFEKLREDAEAILNGRKKD